MIVADRTGAEPALAIGHARILNYVELGVIDDPVRAPITSIIAIDDIVEEGSNFFASVAIGHRRRDVVVAC